MEGKEQPNLNHFSSSEIEEALLASIQDSVRDADDQELRNFVTLLGEHLNKEDGSAEKEKKIIVLLMSSLKAHPSHADLHKHAYALLSRLCSESLESVVSFHTEGGIQAVAAAMKSRPSDADLHVGACELIKCTCVPVPAAADFPAVKRAIAAAVAVAMQAHEGNALVVGPCMTVLEEMTADKPGIKEVLEEELVGVVLAAMHLHPENTIIQLYGCAVCDNIVHGDVPEKHLKMWQGNATRLLLAAMEHVMQDARVDKLEEKAKVMLQQGMHAIFKIHMGVGQPARDEPGSRVIPHVMALDPTSFKLQCYGVASIFVCTESNAPNREHAGAPAVSAILNAIQGISSYEPKFAANVYEALACLCDGVLTNAQLLAQPDNLSILLQYMRKYKQEASAQAYAGYLFTNMAMTLDAKDRQVMYEAGCVHALVEALNEHRNSPPRCFKEKVGDVPMSACSAITRILAQLPDGIRAEALQEGVVDAVMLAMSAHKGEAPRNMSRTILLDGIYALRCIINRHEENVKAAGLKVISTVTEVMQRSTHHPYVVGGGCGLLFDIMDIARNFPDFRTYQDQLCECGALSMVEISLRYSPMMRSSRISWRSSICAALDLVTDAARDHAQNQDQCAEAKMVDAVADIMLIISMHEEHDEENYALYTHACCALKAMSKGHCRNIAAVINHPILKKLSTVVRVRGEYKAELRRLFTEVATQNNLEKQGTSDTQARAQGSSGQNNSTLTDVNEKPNDTEVCMVCGKTAEAVGKELMRCSACTIKPLYCGAECQRAAWKEHKAECKANKRS
jgi:hypothetical protein